MTDVVYVSHRPVTVGTMIVPMPWVLIAIIADAIIVVSFVMWASRSEW